MNIGSLFAGLGGFDLAFSRAGFTVAWQVEIDSHATQILTRHWPEVPKYGDIREVDPAELTPVDVLVGGFPCQDLSIAGKRQGLQGEKSGLFWEFSRIIEGLRPSFVVLENVPGLLSSNGGKDFIVVLDELERLGYVIDPEILDAQEFGVPQRRRRVFITCQSVECIRRTKTPTSAITILQVLTEILLTHLVETSTAFKAGLINLDFPKWLSADGRERRKTLFGLTSIDQLQMWRSTLDACAVKWGPNAGVSLAKDGEKLADGNPPIMAIPCAGLPAEMAEAWRSWNTEPSWQRFLDVIFYHERLFITSTKTSWTIDPIIYISARLMLTICASTVPWKNSCPNYWTLESSLLIGLKGCMNYARQANQSIFTPMEWVHLWNDFLWAATATLETLGYPLDWIRSTSVLFERQSLSGDSPPRRQAGEIAPSLLASGAGTNRPAGIGSETDFLIPEVAGTLGEGSGHRGYPNSPDVTTFIPEVAPTLLAKGNNSLDHTLETYIPEIATTLSAGSAQSPGVNAPGRRREDDTNLIVIQDVRGSTREKTDAGQGMGITASETMYTLDATSQHAVGIFMAGQGAKAGSVAYSESSSPTLRAAGSGTNQVPSVLVPKVTHTLRGEGFDASEDGTGRGTPLVASAVDVRNLRLNQEVSGTLQAKENGGYSLNYINPILASDTADAPLTTKRYADHEAQESRRVARNMMVRRLLPVECERLMGLPDHWTRWDADGKELSDSARYRMIGNSVAVPVVRWIAERMACVLQGGIP